MSEAATIDGTGTLASHGRARAFLVVYEAAGSRVVEVPDDVEVTFGRSRGCTVWVDSERVSRVHAKIVKRGDAMMIEDLGSRNGTLVDGAPVTGTRTLRAGAQIQVGPLVAVVGAAPKSAPSRVVDAAAFEDRLAAELDRCRRFHRAAAVLMVRVSGMAVDAAVEAIAGEARRMDTCAEYAGDELAMLVPETDREAAEVAARRVVALGGAADVRVGIATYPADGASAEALIARARDALRAARRGSAGAVAHATVAAAVSGAGPIVRSAAMANLYALVDRMADASKTVLVVGETGAGKELVAEALHQRSSRKGQALVKLNCAALPENLLESELFGHERGAFTGADRRKIGYVEAADKGTLFLDEIGEMPASLQAKLLRVLETKKVTRVGDTVEHAVDVRIVCATHRDLEAEVAAGRFRADLYFRISALTLVVPPLRDRAEDVVPLAEHFATQVAVELGQAVPAWSPEALAKLRAYDWPGNVRELRNAVERAVVLCDGGELTAALLPDKLRAVRVTPGAAATAAPDIRAKLDDVELKAIEDAMAAEGGNQTKAAARLGLSRRALIYKLEKYGLKPAPKG